MDVRLASHMDCLSTVFLEFRVYHTFSFLSYDARSTNGLLYCVLFCWCYKAYYFIALILAIGHTKN